MQFDTVFERTDAGIGEIHEKSNRLTQSERLVLIMTDGRTDVAMLIEKLPSLSMPRVFRAMAKLQDMGLMSSQLVAPVGLGNANDAIAPDVVERFLQQTDLDPATVLRPAAEDFAPTTLPPSMSLKVPTAPRRDDTDLERRLKTLMGDTPKFAREDPPRVASVAAAVPVAKVAAATLADATRASQPVLTDVAPEDVVRAAKQAAVAAAAPPSQLRASTLPRAAAPAAKSSQAAGLKKMPREQRSSRAQRKRAPPEPPQQSWAVYALMVAGAVLVIYAVARLYLS